MEPSSTPAVTVVIIFLNAEVYITEAIESVLAQTYQDYEIVLVDDGSTDGSTAIARSYAERYPGRIVYTEHEGHANRGMSTSRNHGAVVGRGRYISFLDSDDIWLPTRLETFVAAIERYPSAGMVYGPTLHWYSWAIERGLVEELPEDDDVRIMGLPTDTLYEPPRVMRHFLESKSGNLPGMNSLIIRRQAFEASGGFEPDFHGLYEDQVFLSKMVTEHPVAIIPDVLDYYRQHPDSCCFQAIDTGEYLPDDWHPSRGRYLAWLEQYFRKRGLRDGATWRALRKEDWPYRTRLGRMAYTTTRIPHRVRLYVIRVLPPKAVRGLRSAKHQILRRAGFSTEAG
jgi:glycosyltransferase involved in cell wall biosynthesis